MLTSYWWTKVVRPYWMKHRGPCAWCGGQIDYDGGRYIPGTRRVNRASLVVGHIVGRDHAKLLGWTEDQINAISNTQPEHAHCSDRSGARYGNHKRGMQRHGLINIVPLSSPSTDNSRKW